ncbi:DUF4349 domain-containing protein [Paenibacillus silvisoli]|uniref:DUF4349 domain-containing protein n=1 Tax=Paenibacillus silvisoli TaxID=3110539 RepID=UPI0028043508|nr:DUF4349 domain-containing protein [Paenibacillus silvisoli]
MGKLRLDIPMKRRSGKWIMLVVIAVMVGMLAGCSASNSDRNNAGDGGSASNNSMAASTEAAPPMADGDMAANSSATADSAVAPEEPAEMEQSSSSANVGTATEGGSAVGTIPDGEESFDRKIIYRANVNMEVEDYGKAQTALRNLIHISGGYLLEFADKKTSNELGGTYTIKVPAAGFDTFIGELEKIEHKEFESSAKGTDVTEEYVDMEARLKARQVVEARLISFMEKATKTTDLLQISNQLGEVQSEIERIKGRIRYLDKNVAFSTIELRMYQLLEPVKIQEEEDPAFLKRLTNAMSDSTKVVFEFVQGVFIFIAGALPVLALAALVGIPSYLVFRSSRRRRGAAPATGTRALPAADRSEQAVEEKEEEGPTL